MKLSLVVASGVHTGKAIPVNGVEFLIGRDEDCHLRPASPAISKKHCAVLVRGGKIYVLDLGSTNGTIVNDVMITGEVEVKNGDRLKVGPLDFAVTLTGGKPDGTPLSDTVKKPSAGAAAKPTPASSTSVKPVPPPKPPAKSASQAEIQLDEADAAAAMLLSMGDEDPPGSEPKVPEGSTVMELPAVDAEKLKALEAKKKDSPMSQAESSSAASEILRKYMRRPK